MKIIYVITITLNFLGTLAFADTGLALKSNCITDKLKHTRMSESQAETICEQKDPELCTRLYLEAERASFGTVIEFCQDPEVFKCYESGGIFANNRYDRLAACQSPVEIRSCVTKAMSKTYDDFFPVFNARNACRKHSACLEKELNAENEHLSIDQIIRLKCGEKN